MAATSAWRRRLKRLALVLAAAVALLALGFLCLPLPIGWAINLAAARTLPPELNLKARVASGTFRWRLGNDTASVEITGFEASVKGQPLASVGRLVVEIDKAAVWHGYYAPRLIAVTAPQLVVDATPHGAIAAVMNAPRPAPAAAAANSQRLALIALAPFMPEPGGTAQLRVDGGRVDYIFSEVKWSLVGRTEATLTRTGDTVHLDVEGNLGAPEHPLGANAKVDLNLVSGRIQFAFALPELKTTDLPPLPMGKLPVQGVVSLGLSGDWDYNARELQAGLVDFGFREGQLAWPGIPGPPIAIEEVSLRARVSRRAAGQGTELWGQVDRGVVAIEGSRLEVRKLEATLAARSHLIWETVFTTLVGQRLVPHLPAPIPALAPWLAHALEESQIAEIHSQGSVTIERNPTGAVGLEDLDATHRLTASVGAATIALEAVARQRGAGAIETTLLVKPFEPRQLARALPQEWGLAAAALPVGFSAVARVTSAGAVQDASARVELGAGELLPFGPLPMTVAVREGVLEVRVREDGAKIDVARLSFDTALGFVELRDLKVVRERLRVTTSGQFAMRGIVLSSWKALLPPAALAPLATYGLTLEDFALRTGTTTFAVDVATANGTDWRPARAEATSDFELGVLGKPVGLQVAVRQAEAATDASIELKVKEFRPADFAPRAVAGVALGDFRFPVRFEADARVHTPDGALQTLAARLRVGAGEAWLAPMKVALPFRAMSVDATFDAAKNLVQVPMARMELAPGVEASVQNLKVNLAPGLRVEGIARLAPLTWRDALAWWPAALMPDIRRQAAEAVLEGALRADGIEFVLAGNEKNAGVQPVRVHGGVSVSSLVLQSPPVPGRVTVAEVGLQVDYPRVDVQMKALQMAGFTLTAASASVPDVMAAKPTVTAEADFVLDPGAVAPWLDSLPPSPELAALRRSSGEIRGKLSARSPVSADDFSGANAVLTVVAEKLVVPERFDGPFSARLEVGTPSRRELTLAATLAVTDAKLMALDRKVGASPFALNLTVRDWQAGAATTADFSLQAADFGGLPLRIKAAAQFAADRTPTRAEMQEFVFGHTELKGEWRHVGVRHDAISMAGPRIDVGEMVRMAAPWINLVAPPPPAPPVATPAKQPAGVASAPARPAKAPAATRASAPPTKSAAPVVAVPRPPPAAKPPNANGDLWDVKLDVAEVNFGPTRQLRGVAASASLEQGWPRVAHFAAVEGERNQVTVDVTPEGESRQLKLAVGDAAALVQTLTEPLRTTPLSMGGATEAAKSAAELPTLLSGGAIAVQGEMRQSAEGLFAKGDFSLTDATMIKAPHILQLLAFRSGKNLERSPLIRRLAVGEWSIDPERVEIKGVTLEGTGLIDRVKLNTIRYAFAGEKIGMDGAYFGVGFEVIGTRSDPQVFLKETALIRAVGQRNEFDFFGDDKEPTPAKKK